MSKLCKFTLNHRSFLLDPNTVKKVEEDTDDDTCRLSFYDEDDKPMWVDGTLDEVHNILNTGRS